MAWVLFRRDEDGLEPVMLYGGSDKPEGEFKDRFELHAVWTVKQEPASRLTDERIEFGLNNQLEDPSDDESAGFHAGARWAEAVLRGQK